MMTRHDTGAARASRLRIGLLGTTVLQTALLLAVPARAQTPLAPTAAPAGGSVVAGQASIAQSPSTTLITQGSQRAAIDWTSFNVGSQHTVQFQQPNAGATALNRVTGPDPSQIAGRITANGKLVLINQSGVVFSQGSQVNAQSLVVSTANISNQAFMAGGALHFDQPGKPGASIVNQGNITVGQAGLAALVAPSVVNSGVITATLGRVTLAGATRYTLDLYGDGLLAIDVTGQVRQVPTGANGAPMPALVTNTGTILAAGGTVTLTAAAADGLIKTLVSAGGRIATDNAAGQGGTLVLDAVGGSISIEGAMTATGQTGGQVQAISDTSVQVRSGASINVSGSRQGGTVALGTTLARAKGGAAVTGARTTPVVQVAAGATISADATGIGNGGTVTVLSTGATSMDGMISARGGAAGGDGGAVEVSGNTLGFTGGIDTGAILGHAGSVLFDPTTLDIVGAASGNLNGSLPTIGTGTAPASEPGTVSVSALQAITSGTITLQATQLLDVQASVTFKPGVSVTMQSGGNVTFDPHVVVALSDTLGTIGALTVQSGLALTGGVFTTPLAYTGTGDISFGAGSQLDATRILLHSGTNGVQLGTAAITAGTLDLSAAGGGITQTATGIITANLLQSSAGIVGGLSLPGANKIGTLGNLAVGSGDVLSVNNAQALTIASGVGGADVAETTIATTSGNLSLTSTGNVSAFTVTLQPAGNLVLANQSSITGSNVALLPGGGTISVGTAVTDVANVTITPGDGDGGFLDIGGVITTGILQVAPGSAVPVIVNDTGTILDFTPLYIDIASVGTGTGTLRLGQPGGGTTVASVEIAGALTLNGANLDLETTGVVSQDTGAPITGVGTLTGNVGGDVDFTLANKIATLGPLTVNGGLTFNNAQALSVNGAVGGGFDVDLTTTGGGGSTMSLTGTAALTASSSVTLAPTGNLSLANGASIVSPRVTLDPGGGTISVGTAATDLATVLATPAFSQVRLPSLVAIDGVITGGILQIAPSASQPVALNGVATVGTLDVTVSSGGGTGTGTLRIGDPNTPTAASGLKIVGALSLNGANFDVETSGAVTQTAAVTGVHTLSGGAGGDITLTTAGNGVAALGALTAVGTIALADTAALSVNGSVSATGAGGAITLGTISVPPSLTVTAGTGTLSAQAVTLVAGVGGMALNGSVGQAGGTVDLSTLSGTAGITQPAGGVITAGTLLSSSGIQGPVSLLGANSVATLDAVAVTGGGFTLADSTALTVNGDIGATNIELGVFGASGDVPPGLTITSTGTLAASGNSVTLTAGAGGIALNGGSVSGTTLDLTTTAGTAGIIQTGGTLTAGATGTLTSQGTIGGPVVLDGTFGTISNVLASGSIDITDTLPVSSTLTITGTGLLAGAGTAPLAGAALTLVNTGNAIAVDGPLGSCADFTDITATSISVPTGGLIWGGSGLTVQARTVTVSGGAIGSNGGIALGSGSSSIDVSSGTVVTPVDMTVFGDFNQSGGTVVIGGSLDFITATLHGGILGAGSIDAPSLAFTAGTLLDGNSITFAASQTINPGQVLASGGDVTFNGGLTQTGGTISATGAVSVTNLSQSAGVLLAGGSLNVNGIIQTGGTLAAGGNVTVTESAGFVQGGVIGSSATLSVTAASLTQETGGLLTGTTVNLLATSGDASQDGGLVTGGQIAIQAPHGTVSFGAIGEIAASVGASALSVTATVTCPDCTPAESATATVSRGAVIAATTLGPTPDLTLVGSTIVLPATAVLNTNTLSLFSWNNTTEDAGAVVTSNTLTGSAGVPLATGWTLPAGLTALGWTQASLGWTSATIGNVALDTAGASNIIPTLGGYLATGTFALDDATTLTVATTVAGGYGETGGGVSLDVTGGLAVNAPIVVANDGPGSTGTVTLTATDTITVAGATTEVFAPTAVTLGGGGVVINSGAVVAGGDVTLAAPAKSLTDATVVATNGGGNFAGGATSVDADSAIYSNGTLAFDALTTAGTVASLGAMTLASLSLTGGALIGGSVETGSIEQTGGTLGASGDLTLGSGTGVAGTAGSAAISNGGLDQTGGVVTSGGDIAVWSTGAIHFGGSIEAVGTIGVTASGGITQTGGLVAGAGGVSVLSTGGSATQTGGVVAGSIITVQAPAGGNDFGTFSLASAPSPLSFTGVSVTCPACAVPEPSPPAAPTVVATFAPVGPTTPPAGTAPDITLLGATVTVDKSITADTLELYSRLDTTESGSGAISATVLTGSAGVPSTAWPPPGDLSALGWTQALLGWTTVSIGSATFATPSVNTVQTVGTYLATGGIALVDGALTVTGPVVGGYGQATGSVSLDVTGTLGVTGAVVAASAATGASGTVTLTASDGISISGAETQVFAPTTVAITGASIAVSGGAVVGGGSVTFASALTTLTDATVAAGGAVFSGGVTSLDSSGTIYAAGGLTFDPLTSAGTVAAGGPVTVLGTLTQSGGLLIGGAVTLGALQQAGGVLASAGTITVGTGTGVAGEPSSFATVGGGAVSQDAGAAIYAGTDINLWSSGAMTLAGAVQAGGTIGATAIGDMVQTDGLISGPAGVHLLSQTGNATQSGGVVAAGTDATTGVLITATGTNDFGGFQIAGAPSVATIGSVTISCPACAVPPDTVTAAVQTVTVSPAAVVTPATTTAMAAYPSSTPRVDVTLVGDTIVIDKQITAGTLDLVAGAASVETVNTGGTVGAIDAVVLTGSGAATLNTAGAVNDVQNLAGYAAGGDFLLTDANALTVTGLVGGGTVSLTTTSGGITVTGAVSGSTHVVLASAGTLNDAGGLILTGSLDASAVGDALLTGTNNKVATLGTFTATGGAATLTDAEALLVNGPVSGGTVALTTTHGAVTLAGNVSGDTSVTLTAAGDLTQSAGVIATPLLVATATGDATLPDANLVGTLSSLTSPGTALFTNAESVTVGTVTASTVALTTTAGDIAQVGTITGGSSVTLASAGNDTQSSGGIVVTPMLVAAAGGDAILGDANQVVTLATLTATGDALLTNAQALGVGTASGATVTLTTTAGGLTLTGGVSAVGDATLTAATDLVLNGNVTGGGDVAVTATGGAIALNGASISSGGNATLTATTGVALAGNLSGGGDVTVAATGGAIALNGASISSVGDTALTATTGVVLNGNVGGGGDVTVVATGGAITLNGASISSGANATLSAATGITLDGNVTAGGDITVSSATGGVSLNGLTSAGQTVEVSATAGGISVGGNVTGAGAVLLTSGTGGIALGSVVNGGGGVTLVTAGSVNEDGGIISTPLLTGNIDGAVTLNDVNQVAQLGALTAGGAASLVDGQTLLVGGPVNAASVKLTVTDGNMTLAGPIVGAGFVTAEVDAPNSGALTLNAGAPITSGGTIALLAPNITVAAGDAGAGASLTAGADILLSTLSNTAASSTSGNISVGANASFVAPRIDLGTVAAGNTIAVADGVTLNATGGNTLDTLGQPFYVPGKSGTLGPLDRTDGKTGGVYITLGAAPDQGDGVLTSGAHNGFSDISGSGSISLGNVMIGGPMLRLALPDNLGGATNSGGISFGTLTPIGTASHTVVLAWLGNGTASGTLLGQQLGVLATSPNATAQFLGSVSNGVTTFQAGSTAAAAAGSQGLFTGASQLVPDTIYNVLNAADQIVLYRPNTKLQLSGCAISSINCRLVVVVQVPPLVELEALATIVTTPDDDFDVLLPDISDREY